MSQRSETELKNEIEPLPVDAQPFTLGRRLALILALLSLLPLVWTTYLVATAPSPRSDFLADTALAENPTTAGDTAAGRDFLLEVADKMAGDLQLHPVLRTFDEDWYFEFIRERIVEEQDATQFADLHAKLDLAYQRQFELHWTIAIYFLAVSLVCFVLALVMWLKPWAPLSLFLLAGTLGSAPPATELFIGLDLGLSGLFWSVPGILLAVGILCVVVRNLKIWRQRAMHPWQSLLLGLFLIGVGVVWVSVTADLPSHQRAISKFGIDPHPSHAGLVMVVGGVLLAGIGIYRFWLRLGTRNTN